MVVCLAQVFYAVESTEGLGFGLPVGVGPGSAEVGWCRVQYKCLPNVVCAG